MVRPLSAKGTSGVLLAVWSGLCAAGGGCVGKESCTGPFGLSNQRFGHLTVAVAPALNFSGSSDFDPNQVADLMASELGHVDGISVIPVSRVLAILSQQGRREVESPSHALDICERVGADAILVFAVTEYDPYDPPIVGLAAQLYGQVPGGGLEDGVDPILVSRQGRATAHNGRSAGRSQPIAQAQRVFNAAHEYVGQRVKRFAERRGVGKSPYGWRLYLVSQEHYLRFCCWATLETLVGPAGDHGLAEGPQGEVKTQ